MREMKDSGVEWIGEIPTRWKLKKIKHSFNIIAGATPKSEVTEFWDGDIAWITPADYKTADVYVAGGKRNLSQAGYDSCGTTLIPSGSIVFSKRAPIGSVAINTNDLCTNQGCLSCVPKCECVTKYFYYMMSVFTEIFNLFGTGTTFKEISADNFANFSLPFPDIKEQYQIVSYLDHKCAEIDAVIEKTKATIEEYKKLKQSVITEAVTKGIRGDRPMKDSGIEWIGDICYEYDVCRMKFLLSEPLMYGANETGIPYEETLPRYIRITDITGDGKLKDNSKLSLSEDAASPYILKDNDVLFARSGGTVGKAFIYKKEYGKSAFAGYLIKASTNDKLLSDYLFYYTQSSLYEEWKKQIFIQATIQNIGADRYNNLPIVLPSVEEQYEIVSYLQKKCTEMDTLIAKKTALLEEMESYKKSVIYEYVTGKKEVR